MARLQEGDVRRRRKKKSQESVRDLSKMNEVRGRKCDVQVE